jgi:hypothetical protein
MNILIAGIVGVIMLLVGGTKYYTHYIRPERELEREQEQTEDRKHQFYTELHELDVLDLSRGNVRIIESESQLQDVLDLFPNLLPSLAIAIPSIPGISQILQSHNYTDAQIREIIEHQFLTPEGDRENESELRREWREENDRYLRRQHQESDDQRERDIESRTPFDPKDSIEFPSQVCTEHLEQRLRFLRDMKEISNMDRFELNSLEMLIPQRRFLEEPYV